MKIVVQGSGILDIGIVIMIFWTSWFGRENITNPIGLILAIASIFGIGSGFRISMSRYR